MTKDKTPNRFGRFIFEDEQAERVAAGDMSAVWEFIEDNRQHLTRWARKYIRYNLSFFFFFMHGKFYKPDDLINQICVDFPLYTIDNEKTLGRGIYCSFKGITSGGYRGSFHGQQAEIRLDAVTSIIKRNGQTEKADTIKDMLPSREPTPEQALFTKEHVKELAPRYFHEIGRIFGRNTRKAFYEGATVAEILAYEGGEVEIQVESFRDVIEEVFFGYTFEEVERYAKRQA